MLTNPLPSRQTDPGGDVGPKMFLRISDVSRKVGLCKSSIYAQIKAQLFPKPVKIAVRASAWDDKEVEKWMQSRIASRNSAPTEAK